jgi:hypothetical protein
VKQGDAPPHENRARVTVLVEGTLAGGYRPASPHPAHKQDASPDPPKAQMVCWTPPLTVGDAQQAQALPPV